MSKSKKKSIRTAFRIAVFERDGGKCRVCGHIPCDASIKIKNIEIDPPLDAHHITDRNLMPNGGYVKENGISLCGDCHKKAEEHHRTGVAVVGYSPDELYTMIGSSYDDAIKASEAFND